MNTLTPEAIEMLADDYERGMIGPRRLRQYFDYLIQQLAAANARVEQAEAQCAAYKKALDIAMSTNQSHETYCKVEAALEGKP